MRKARDEKVSVELDGPDQTRDVDFKREALSGASQWNKTPRVGRWKQEEIIFSYRHRDNTIFHRKYRICFTPKEDVVPGNKTGNKETDKTIQSCRAEC